MILTLVPEISADGQDGANELASPRLQRGSFFSASESAELRRTTRETVRGVLLARQRIRTPLAIGGKVAVFQVVAGEALVASGEVVFKYGGEGKAGRAVHVHFVWGEPGDGAEGIVVTKSYVRQVDVPVVLSLVDDNRERLSHGGIEALYVTHCRWGGSRSSRFYACLEACTRQVTAWSMITAHCRRGGWPNILEEVFFSLTKMSAVPSAVNSAAETACHVCGSTETTRERVESRYFPEV